MYSLRKDIHNLTYKLNIWRVLFSFISLITFQNENNSVKFFSYLEMI